MDKNNVIVIFFKKKPHKTLCLCDINLNTIRKVRLSFFVDNLILKSMNNSELKRQCTLRKNISFASGWSE